MPSPLVRSENCGHVFVLHCDSTGLAADALLLANAIPDGPVCLAGQRDGKTRVFNAPSLTLDPIEQTVSESVTVVKDFFAAAAVALQVAAEEAKAVARKEAEETAAAEGKALEDEDAGPAVPKSVFGRGKPLFALPLLGAGDADITDAITQEGLLVKAILPLVYQAANEHGVDIALCTTCGTAYKILQVQRGLLCPFPEGPFWMLSPGLRKESERLAIIAKSGSLSIFFGAGVSFPSGLPSWGGLLKSLAVAGGFNEEEQKALKDLDYLDQPTIIEERMGSKKFRGAIAELVGGGLFTPGHALLSDLRAPTATTNYDDLFERSALGEVLRLPWDSGTISERTDGLQRSLIKLHGCVSHPESIVLTRKDYMRYGMLRQAVRGLVHEKLLTTHIVFIGFSMTDTNLHLIIDDVRRSLGKEGGVDPEGTLGTILCMTDNAMFRELWDQDFKITAFGKSWDDNPAWFHDCFLDSIGSEVAKKKAISSFVLDQKFVALLTPAEKKIKEALLPVMELAKDGNVRGSPAWPNLHQMLESFGANVV